MVHFGGISVVFMVYFDVISVNFWLKPRKCAVM